MPMFINLLLLLALVAFVLAALNFRQWCCRWLGVGLALFVLTVLLPRLIP